MCVYSEFYEHRSREVTVRVAGRSTSQGPRTKLSPESATDRRQCNNYQRNEVWRQKVRFAPSDKHVGAEDLN
jgi:hypothetical protein